MTLVATLGAATTHSSPAGLSRDKTLPVARDEGIGGSGPRAARTTSSASYGHFATVPSSLSSTQPHLPMLRCFRRARVVRGRGGQPVTGDATGLSTMVRYVDGTNDVALGVDSPVCGAQR